MQLTDQESNGQKYLQAKVKAITEEGLSEQQAFSILRKLQKIEKDFSLKEEAK